MNSQTQKEQEQEQEEKKDNTCGISKFQQFSYNNSFINSINNEKNANKISIYFRKPNSSKNKDDNNDDDDDKNVNNTHKNYLNDEAKRYFSFDGGNQNNDEIFVVKNKENVENKKIKDDNMNNEKNEDNKENKNDMIKSENIIDKEKEKKINLDRNIKGSGFTANQKNRQNN